MMSNTEGTTSDKAEIGARLKQARELAGLTQGQVAKLLNLHRPSISEIEAGRRRVSAEELRSMAEAYSVSMTWLTEGATVDDLDDARYQIAARELTKLSPEDLDRLLALITLLKKTEGNTK